MATILRFEDLEVWQKASDKYDYLIKEIISLSERLGKIYKLFKKIRI